MIEVKVIIKETKQGRTQLELRCEPDMKTATMLEAKATKEVSDIIREVLHVFALTKINPAVAETKEDIATLRSMEDIDLI